MVHLASIKNWFNHSLVAVLLVAGCSGPSGPEAQMTVTTTGDARAVPWPSDALLGADGKVFVKTPLPFDSNVEDNLVSLAAVLSTADGFSTTRSVFFPVSEDLVVDDGATATVIDLDDPSKAIDFPLFYRVDTKQLVAMAPLGTALLEHHQYGCFVAAGAHDMSGHALHPSSAMRDAMAGNGDVGKRASYQKLAKALKAMSVDPQAATAFTTQTLTAWAQKAATDLAAMPPKVTVELTFSAPTDLDNVFGGPATTTKPGHPPSGGVLHSNIAAVVTGHFDSPHYLAPTPGTLGVFDDAMSVKATDHIPYILVLPIRSNYASTPIVIFQHGINSDRSAVLTVANSYAARGYATLGIDELWHGSRLPGNVDEKFNLSGQPGHDGIGDPTASGAVQYFFDFAGDPNVGALPVDPHYIRDNFRQAEIDLMQEVRLARGGDFSAVVTALPQLTNLSFDGSKVVYTGESFGSIMGAAVLAVDPLLEAAVLDVGGGGILSDLAPNAPQFATLLQPFIAGAFDTIVDVNHPDTEPVAAQMSLQLVQSVIDPGDGLALAASADPGKSVLFLFAYLDETVPNQSNQSLARGFGATEVPLTAGTHPLEHVRLPMAPAPYMASPLRAVVQLDPAAHGMYTGQTGQHEFMPPFPPFNRYATPIKITLPIVQAHALALGFIDGFRSGAPVVNDVPTSN
jgi:dienelactone hydrolase